MVPVLITGAFASPKIRPDLKGMIGGDITKSIEGLKEGLIPNEGSKVNIESTKEDVKTQLKGLLPGLIK
jgi:AsmA protein